MTFKRNQLRQKEDLLEQKYLTGSMPLLATNHSYTTCDGPEALTSITILKKLGKTTSSGGEECYTVKTNLALPYQ